VLDYLVDAGLTREEAAHVAWEHTCFPLDCELAVAQASEWLAANRPAKAGEKGG
jgi:predicted kinase